MGRGKQGGEQGDEQGKQPARTRMVGMEEGGDEVTTEHKSHAATLGGRRTHRDHTDSTPETGREGHRVAITSQKAENGDEDTAEEDRDGRLS